MIIVLTFLSVPFMHPAHATETWNDSISLYPYATTMCEGIREINNNGSSTFGINVEYNASSNMGLLKKYVLSGNGTTFITITDGIVTQSSGTFYLMPNETLAFNVEASPINNATGIVSVTVLVMYPAPIIVWATALILAVLAFIFALISFTGTLTKTNTKVLCVPALIFCFGALALPDADAVSMGLGIISLAFSVLTLLVMVRTKKD